MRGALKVGASEVLNNKIIFNFVESFVCGVSVVYALVGWEILNGVSLISSYASFPYCCLALNGERESRR